MSEHKEAVIVLAKCGKSHKAYGMRVEKRGKNNWVITWAFPIKESSAKREGYDKTTIKGSLQFSGNYPGCPYCGGKNFTVCSCGHLNCTILKNGMFTCEWCGKRGVLGPYGGEAIRAGMDL